MAQLSDEELLFLSNLMHIKNEKPFSEIWKEKYVGKEGINIGTLLEDIDINKLATDYADTIFDGEISGAEWAQMIIAIRQNETLCSLQLEDLERDDKKALSVCLKDPETNQRYVVFRGTAAGEWPDNFEGGYLADTEQQRRALAFINRQQGEHITVVGHSKGGNKAKYVAILSEKVDRCVSFDGQGFSQAFWKKYGPQIEKNKHKITCYALDFDFVNILLTDIFGEKNYVKGYGIDNFFQNHSPNSLFHMWIYKGENKLRMGYAFDLCEQSEEMQELHNFINYIVNTGDSKEVKSLMDFLGNIVNFTMGKQPPDYTQSYPAGELRKYLLNTDNAKELGTLIAYLIQYDNDGNNIIGVIEDLLWEYDLAGNSGIKSKGIALILKALDESLGGEYILENLNIPNVVLALVVLGLIEEGEESEALIKALSIAQKRQKEIPASKGNCSDLKISCIKRDFSDEMRTTLLNLVEEVENEEYWDFSKWDMWYRLEDWCGRLNVEHYKNNIQKYHRKVIDINDITKKQMQNIFDAIDELDIKYGQIFQNKVIELHNISKEVKNIMA